MNKVNHWEQWSFLCISFCEKWIHL